MTSSNDDRAAEVQFACRWFAEMVFLFFGLVTHVVVVLWEILAINPFSHLALRRTIIIPGLIKTSSFQHYCCCSLSILLPDTIAIRFKKYKEARAFLFPPDGRTIMRCSRSTAEWICLRFRACSSCSLQESSVCVRSTIDYKFYRTKNMTTRLNQMRFECNLFRGPYQFNYAVFLFRESRCNHWRG